ncbi:hypothetical protein LSUE1_G006318 [Lachnellula suecica]|uniref:Uncharacterized protein n=1 Tax=Lachnellula suecica TaxID=602035 RepID=A0A8T9BZ60_9HELO|nr:hypothetical protein LSUE1_G006318 [Lachnellula suecica]
MDSFSIIVPDGPTVAVHKGWRVPGQRHVTPLASFPQIHQENRSQSDIVSRGSTPKIGRHFEFVNAVKPGRNRDPEVRKLVRSHVRQEHLRTATHSNKRTPPTISGAHRSTTQTSDGGSPQSVPSVCSTTTPPTPPSSSALTLSTNPAVPRNIGFPTALLNFDYPIEMTASVHTLLDHYLTHAPRRVFPLESCLKSNPLKSPEWFQYAMRDSAMLHGMLYAGALYLALLEGRTETKDSMHHLGQVVGIVNKRLCEADGGIDDATIGAISCLALGEKATSGNSWESTSMADAYARHQANDELETQHLSHIRASPSKASSANQTSPAPSTTHPHPLLDFNRSPRQSTWSLLSAQRLDTTNRDMRLVLTKCGVHPELIGIMTELACFSQAIRFASEASIFFDPTTFSEDLYWLEYSLLDFSSRLPPGEAEVVIDKACRLGALLYMKAILEEFPHSATGSRYLLTQLRASLGEVPIDASNNPLLLWLSLVGGSMSKGETRAWFVDYLAQIKMVALVPSFDEYDVDLSRMLGLQRVFGRTFETLWDETLIRSGEFFSR